MRRHPNPAFSLVGALLTWSAAGRRWAQGATRRGAVEPWTPAVTLLVVALAILSILAVLALIPFTAEYWKPSASMEEHRRRLKGLGAPGRLTEKLLPRLADGCAPQQLWGYVLYACWGGIVALFAAFGLGSRPDQHLHNLLMLAVFAIGLPLFFAFILRFGRGVTRLSQAAATAPDRRSSRSRTVTEAGGATDDGGAEGAETHA